MCVGSRGRINTNDVTNFLVRATTWLVKEFSIGKSRSLSVRRLWRCLSLKETKSSLVPIIDILKIINACQDSVKHGKNCTDEWFYSVMRRHNVSVKSKLQHAPLPDKPPGIWLFWKLLFKFPPTRAKMLFKCSTLGSIQVIKCPHPGDISQAQKWQKDGGNAFSCRTKSL